VKGFSTAAVSSVEAGDAASRNQAGLPVKQHNDKPKTHMKLQRILIALLMALLGQVASAQVWSPNAVGVYQFPFPPGTDLPGQTEANGITWAATGPAGPPITIASNSLAVAGLDSPVANRARLAGVNGPAARIGLGTNVTTGTLYYSLALRVANVGSLSTNGGTLAGFNNTTGPSQSLPRPLAAGLALRPVSAGQLGLSLRTDESGDKFWPDGWWWDFQPNQTVFVVASFTPASGESRVWINPASAVFGAFNAPPPDLIATTTNVFNQLSSFVLMQQPTLPGVTFVDEVRVGTTWASVTPPQQQPNHPPTITAIPNQAID
jgi:hypothetical protein